MGFQRLWHDHNFWLQLEFWVFDVFGLPRNPFEGTGMARSSIPWLTFLIAQFKVFLVHPGPPSGREEGWGWQPRGGRGGSSVLSHPSWSRCSSQILQHHGESKFNFQQKIEYGLTFFWDVEHHRILWAPILTFFNLVVGSMCIATKEDHYTL